MGRDGKLFDQEGREPVAGHQAGRGRSLFFDQDALDEDLEQVEGGAEGARRDPIPAWPEPAPADPSGQPILRITSSPVVRPSPFERRSSPAPEQPEPPAPAEPVHPQAPAPAAQERAEAPAPAGRARPQPPAAGRPEAPAPALRRRTPPPPAGERPEPAPAAAPGGGKPRLARLAEEARRAKAAGATRAPEAPAAAPPAAERAGSPAAAKAAAASSPADRASAPASPPPGAAPGGAPARPAPSLAASSAVMASGTLLSRLTGFARVVLVATILGASGLGDAYNLANSVPNIVYDLLLGGILSATLVPVFVDELSRRGGKRAVNAIVTTVGLSLVVASAALYLLAPEILRFYLLLNHQTGKAAEQQVGADLLHLFAPQVFLLGAIVVSTALLNARRRFAAAAFSPVLNNVIAIAALLATRAMASDLRVGPFRHEHSALLVLGVGTTVGYLVQLLVQWPAQRRAGFRFRPVFDFRHPAVRRVAGLSAWLIGTVVANQVAFNLILIYAARKQGDVTVYTTAYQFFQLPYALFTVSLASTLTPDLAERWSAGDVVGFRRRMTRGLRVTLGIMVPAAAGYAIVARPLIDLGVLYGHVTPSGAHDIGASLALFAVGLPGFSAFALLMRAFQAMTDTRTMFWMYVAENAMTLVVAVVAYPYLGVEGLAVAFIAPYTVVAVVAARRLSGRIGTLGGSLTIRALVRITLAGAAMVVALEALSGVLPAGAGHVALVVRLVALVGAGTVVYVAAAKLLGIGEIEPVLAFARRPHR